MASPQSIFPAWCPIVHQETHPHPPLSRGHQSVHQELAGQVVIKVVVLQIQGPLRLVDGQEARQEGVLPAGQEVKPRFSLVPDYIGLNPFAHVSLFRQEQSTGDRARVIQGEAGATVQQRRKEKEACQGGSWD